jgi:hypothetical protein
MGFGSGFGHVMSFLCSFVNGASKRRLPLRSKQSIVDGLTSNYSREHRRTEILLDDEVIGGIVSYGDRNAMADRRRTTFPKTVYRADATFEGHRHSFEGTSIKSALNKLADGIHKAQRHRIEEPEAPRLKGP